MLRKVATLALFLAVIASVGCGGGTDPVDVDDPTDVPEDVADDVGGLDVQDTAAADTPTDDVATDADGTDGFDSLGQDVPDDSDDVGDSPDVTTVCTVLTVATDCADACAGAVACQECVCNTEVAGGRCELVTADDGSDCEDGENCTRDDYCENGTCLPGRLACECARDSDCDAKDDANACNGKLFCNKQVFPYVCEVDPLTIPAPCLTDNDTQCLANQCVPETGECSMLPYNEGEDCTIVSICILQATCQDGVCAAFRERDCNDNNPCTDDQCVEQLGCVRLPNTGGCDDNNKCTVGDTCMDGECGHTGTLECDNGKFCDGPEGCDPVTGCTNGVAPTCSDGNSCTEDRCLAFYDRCFNDWIPTATEGPRGASKCSDGIDNDCDGLKDVLDPECLLGINQIEPDDGVMAGGDEITLTGNSFDLVESVTIDGRPATILSKSGLSLEVVTPQGQVPGLVDVAVSTNLVTYTATSGFTYTAAAAVPQGTCRLVSPSTPVERDTGASIVVMTGQSLLPTSLDQGLVRFSFGYGPRGSNPNITPGWRWTDAGPTGTVQVGDSYRTDWSVLPVAAQGGYFDMAGRMSTDGGVHWTPCDLDGSSNGYLPSQAPDLTVFGTAEVGDIVINEMMWAATPWDVNDEWVELRNVSDAPIRLSGWKISGLQYPSSQDFLFEGTDRVVNNLVIEGGGYFLISQFDAAHSALGVEPDILAQDPSSSSRTLRLGNSGPRTYNLIDDREIIIDSAYFSASYGMIGSLPLNEPYRSMERKADPGEGTTDSDWLSAYVADGWDDDPFQSMLMGTPRAPNSDMALCSIDSDCGSFHPEIAITLCQRRICDQSTFRCDIVDVQEGGACEDGLYCTVGEKCISDVCGGGVARDCSDVGGQALCTIDTCDETNDTCVHVFDNTVTEGPKDSADCRDILDNDCDGLTDSQDFQCLLDVTSVTPDKVPVAASVDGWAGSIGGLGFYYSSPVVTGVAFSGPGGWFPADSFLVVDVDTLTAMFPTVSQAGYYDILVTDGEVTAILADAVLFFGTADDMQARISAPTDAMSVKVNQSTPYIRARVAGAAIGSGDAMIDSSLIVAELGYGPEISDPTTDQGWTWLPAALDTTCVDCVDEYQFRRTLSISVTGVYAIAYRFSTDGGVTWAWGTIGPYSSDPWDPAAALTVTVNP